MSTLSQKSFSGGEISPALYARTDINKYFSSLRTMRNFFTMKHGGAANRPGTKFVCEIKDSTTTIKFIPFVFNTTQTYVLEFGDQYMRVIKDGAQVLEASKTITGITKANPGVVTTSGSHGYSNGDEVYISDVGGMAEVNGRSFKVSNVGATTFELQDMTSTDIDTSSYTTYTSGGTSEKVYEISTDYVEADLSEIQYIQSADVVTIVHPSYPPAELQRTGDTSWTLTDISFEPGVDRPTGVSVSAGGASTKTFRYKVTAIKADTYEESYAGLAAAKTITGATQADPCVITATSHSYSNGDIVYIDGISGMTELNGKSYTIANKTTNTFELVNVDSTAYTAYSSSGSAYLTGYTLTSAADPTSAAPHVISWTTVSGAIEYNVYKESNGIFGFIGVAGAGTFSDTNIDADTTKTPPIAADPFDEAGDYPSTVSYFQQRLIFGNTNNNTETIFPSRIGKFKNFSKSSPIQDDDSFSFTMAGRQVNAIKHMIDIGAFVVLTEGGEWTIEGDAGVLTPTGINPKQHSYSGANSLPPIPIGGSALFCQARGSVVRDLAFNYEVDGYSGNDLTIFSSHLFEKYTLSDWAYQQIPNSILWVARSDGTLLGLTYIKEQQMLAWHRHDFEGGTVENVCVVPEGSEDVLYVLIKRTVDGRTTRYIEKMSTRQVDENAVEDLTFLDSHLSYDGRHTGSTTMTLAINTKSPSAISKANPASVSLTSHGYITGQEVSFSNMVGMTELEGVSSTVTVVDANTFTLDDIDSTAYGTFTSGDCFIDSWDYDATLKLTASGAAFTSSSVGNQIHLTGSDGSLIRFTIEGYTSTTVVTGKPDITVPATMKTTAMSTWSEAVDVVSGLWHLEGKSVSVFADGFVVANPNNGTYDVVTVSGGSISLDKQYAVIHVGLPYTSDLETLDIDVAQGETLADKKKLVKEVTAFVESSRGMWVGEEAPSGDTTDGLYEVKVDDSGDYDSPIALTTGIMDSLIRGSWNSNGRVFVRQVDPIPLSILSIAPAGLLPIRG